MACQIDDCTTGHHFTHDELENAARAIGWILLGGYRPDRPATHGCIACPRLKRPATCGACNPALPPAAAIRHLLAKVTRPSCFAYRCQTRRPCQPCDEFLLRYTPAGQEIARGAPGSYSRLLDEHRISGW